MQTPNNCICFCIHWTQWLCGISPIHPDSVENHLNVEVKIISGGAIEHVIVFGCEPKARFAENYKKSGCFFHCIQWWYLLFSVRLFVSIVLYENYRSSKTHECGTFSLTFVKIFVTVPTHFPPKNMIISTISFYCGTWIVIVATCKRLIVCGICIK